MSKHGLFICFCGMHVPEKHWDRHLKGDKHKRRQREKEEADKAKKQMAKKK